MSSKLAEITARFEAADAAEAAALAHPTQTETPATDPAGDVDGAAPTTAPDGTPEASPEAVPTQTSDDKPPAWWDKALQREQQERANITREIASLKESIAARGGSATSTESRQLDAAAANLQVSTQRLTKIKGMLGKDFDAFEKGGEALGEFVGVVEDQDTRIRAIEAENAALRQRLEARDAQETQQAQARQFWPEFERKNPGIQGEKLWHDAVQELHSRGYEGDRLAGAAEVLFQSRVDAALAAKKSTSSPPNAASAPTPAASRRAPAITPGGAQIVPTGAGARPPASKSAQQAIDDGDVDFFGGRYAGR